MAHAVDWPLAERVAQRVAGRDPFASSYLYSSLTPDLTELTARAEELVTAETGLRSLAGPARCRVVGRPDWIRVNVRSFQRLLRPVLQKLEERTNNASALGAAGKLAAIEVGTMLGWMSGRVLGQYDLLVIDDETAGEQDVVYYVGPNVLALEKRFAFPPREFRLWLALHEVTHRAQFTGVPWLRGHFLGLVDETLGGVDPDPKRVFSALRGALTNRGPDGASLDDGGLPALLATPEQRVALQKVAGLMALLEGHGDVTMDRAGASSIPNAERFSRVLRERRKAASPLVRLIQRLTGLSAKLAQYEQGERFIAAIEAVSGPRAIDVCWEGPDRLPTLDEIRQPQRWLDRVGSGAVSR
jgi:coenzyme F420 biosynthesis associated uncharacterized protein